MARLRLWALRLVCAAVLTTLLLAAASAALTLTSAPAPVSLLLEPVSLLFLPGLLIALPFAGSHSELSAAQIMGSSAAFYFLLLAFLTARWLRPPLSHSPSR